MKKKLIKISLIVVAVLLLIPIGFVTFLYTTGNSIGRYKENFDRSDITHGPYIFSLNDSTWKVSYVKNLPDDQYKDSSVIVNQLPKSFKVQRNAPTPIDFQVEPKPGFSSEQSVYENIDKFAVISDIEGNFNVLKDMLIKSGIIDHNLDWKYGNGHLVLLGDFMDRGYFVQELLWFIYKLEQDALKHEGKVHFVLGNHEIMNLHGNFWYSKNMYFITAKILGKEPIQLYDQHSFIGKWMRQRPVMLKINDNLFCHAGVSPELLQQQLTVQQINNSVRSVMDKHPFSPGLTALQKLIIGEEGPLWYRGYFGKGNYKKCSEEHVNQTCLFYEVNRIMVGHTTQRKINTHFDGKVVCTDVRVPREHKNYFPARHAAILLYQNNTFTVLNDEGSQSHL